MVGGAMNLGFMSTGAVIWLVALASGGDATPPTVEVRVPIEHGRDVDLGRLIAKLVDATGVQLGQPKTPIRIPVVGLGGSLARTTLETMLGESAQVRLDPGELILQIDRRVLEPENARSWTTQVRTLVEQLEREHARRLANYGMKALPSYRPNDPTRPTVCLVHGLNSSSGGFTYMIKPIEDAGYGVVVFDYPYNRALKESGARFKSAWRDFRRNHHETRPWAIVAHSMGALVARSWVEDPGSNASEFASLILIAPVNQGSSLAKTQTLVQLLKGLQAVQNQKTNEAISQLSDGLGEAANDMLPGSTYLKTLNQRPRRTGVPYHILAGDAGLISLNARKNAERQLASMAGNAGFFGGLTRLATTELADHLDELSDGTGDGCVSIRRARLDGAPEPVVIHSNHAELIRAPLLFDEPGPVDCMPYVLRWLKEAPAFSTKTGSRPQP